jgi:molybdopterin molybdotransferase
LLRLHFTMAENSMIDGAGTPPAQRVADVRMRGFGRRTRVQDAWFWLDAQSETLASEQVELTQAYGRVLAGPIHAPIDVPGFDRAQMDGYALRSSETVGASSYNPLSFREIGQSLVARPFEGRVESGTAVRIMTGAPVPAGADAVLPAEYAEAHAALIEASSSIAPGSNIGRKGEDMRSGDLLFSPGRVLRPQDVGLVASLGQERIPVVRRPRVRIVATGSELVAPGKMRREHQVFDANSVMLQGLLARDGAELESIRRPGDDASAIAAAMLAPGVDVVLVSGGSSVGSEDHAPAILAREGELAVHGLALRPASPAGMGRIDEVMVFLLPGNPASCLCAYDFFAGRTLRQLGGLSAGWPYERRRLRAGRKISSAVGRVDYARVRLEHGEIVPLAVSAASILSSTTRADGFVVIPASSEGVAPGTLVEVYFYGPQIQNPQSEECS